MPRPRRARAGAGRRVQRRAGRRHRRPDGGPTGECGHQRRRRTSCARRRARCGTTSSSPRLEHGLGGLECLSGIPGSAGATPVQNVGAYGAEVSDTIRRVRLLDRATGEDRWVGGGELGFGYRTSVLKHSDAAIVLEVEFALDADGRSAPLRYGELTSALGAEPGARTDPARVRDAVLALRRRKGMVLDEADHDTWSVGSFFTNPVVTPAEFDRLERTSADARAQLPGAERGEAGRRLAGRAAPASTRAIPMTRRRPGCPRSMRWPDQPWRCHCGRRDRPGQTGARRCQGAIRDRTHTRAEPDWDLALGILGTREPRPKPVPPHMTGGGP